MSTVIKIFTLAFVVCVIGIVASLMFGVEQLATDFLYVLVFDILAMFCVVIIHVV